MSIKTVIALAKQFHRYAQQPQHKDTKVSNLGLKLQDAWHYFDSILGGGTFSGNKGDTLLGKLNLYNMGKMEAIEALSMMSFEFDIHDAFLNMPDNDEIKTEAELLELAKHGRKAVEAMAAKYNIDALTGELKE